MVIAGLAATLHLLERLSTLGRDTQNAVRFEGAYSEMEEEEEIVEMSESDLLKLLDQQEPALQARSIVPLALRSQHLSAVLVRVRCARDYSANQPKSSYPFRFWTRLKSLS